MTWSFQAVDSTRQRWEDAINAGFEHIRSSERVCWHANATVTAVDGGYMVFCDYCPAWSTAVQAPVLPAPWYFKDEDPLKI